MCFLFFFSNKRGKRLYIRMLDVAVMRGGIAFGQPDPYCKGDDFVGGGVGDAEPVFFLGEGWGGRGGYSRAERGF